MATIARLVQRLPRALWELLLHAVYLLLTSAACALLPPVLLATRCAAAVFTCLFGTSVRDARGLFDRCGVVVINADSPSGRAVADFFAELGIGLVVACGERTHDMHEFYDARPNVKLVRTTRSELMHETVLGTLRTSGVLLSAVVVALDSKTVGASAAPVTPDSLAGALRGPAAVVDALRPLLSAAERRGEAANRVCAPKVVVLDDATSVPATVIGTALSALLRQSGSVSTKPVAEGGVTFNEQLPLNVAHLRLITSGPFDAKAGQCIGEAVCETSGTDDGAQPRLIATTAYSRALLDVELPRWIQTAIPRAMGMRALLRTLLLPPAVAKATA